MKKVCIYIILIIFEIALGISYGLLLQNIIPFGVCLLIAFFVPFLALSISFINKRDIYVKLIEILVLSLLAMSVFILVFSFGNQLRGEFIDEYDVIVEYVNGRGGGIAEFTTPQGKEGRVNLHDYRPIIFDDNNYVEVGDKIRVREYKGVFNQFYYVFVEEIH